MSSIKESEDFVLLAKDLAKVIVASKADGHVNLWDAPRFASLIPDIAAALEGSELIAGELEDMTDVQAHKIAGDAIEALGLLVAALSSKPKA